MSNEGDCTDGGGMISKGGLSTDRYDLEPAKLQVNIQSPSQFFLHLVKR
jgi:hypothetical protein